MQHVAIRRSAGLAIPALVVANIALAIGPWLVRIAKSEGHVGPVGAGFWRLALALPLLILFARGERNAPRPADKTALIVAAIASGLFFAIDLGAWHTGILHTRLANATLLGNCTAILFPAYGFIVARSLPSRKQGVALALATLGAVLLLGRSYELSARNLVGDLLCLFAGVAYTAYLVTVDRARGGLAPWTTLAWSVGAGIPVLLAVAFALGDPVWPLIWWPLIAMTLGSQIIGQGLILYAVSRVSALVVGLMLLLQPVVAATIGWIVYGERLTLFDFVGAIAIAAALLLVRDSGRSLPSDEMSLVS
ncbi:MAG: DMT family transporter [Sphingomonas sp.]|nr:DMT family transporter [Sphingomonas sp.]